MSTSNHEFLAFPAGRRVLGISAEEMDDLGESYPDFGPEWLADCESRIVDLPAFEIARHSVTSADFATTLNEAIDNGEDIRTYFLASSPFLTIEAGPDGYFRARPGDEEVPMAAISLAGARRHAVARSARLPTESEWEVAARWHIESRDDWHNLSQAMSHANGFDTVHAEIRRRRRAFLDGRGPVEESVFDNGMDTPQGMIGNLWEWCVDEHGGACLCGGCWNDIVPLCFHPSFRHRVSGDFALVTHVGCRLACSIEEE